MRKLKAPAPLYGQRFGSGVVRADIGRTANGSVLWELLCDCGNVYKATTQNLRSGNTKSCGCWQRKRASETSRVHGLSQGVSRLYGLWQDAKNRCTNPNNKNWADYGGRGIRMWPAWLTDAKSYVEYIEALPRRCTFDPPCNEPPEAHRELDRIDNDGHYELGNLRWATRREQRINQRTEQRARSGRPKTRAA